MEKLQINEYKTQRDYKNRSIRHGMITKPGIQDIETLNNHEYMPWRDYKNMNTEYKDITIYLVLKT